MNTIQSRYNQHVKSVYSMERLDLPEKTRVSCLIMEIDAMIQPLLMKDAYEQKHGAVWNGHRFVQAEYEIAYLNNLAKPSLDCIARESQALAQELGLDNIIIKDAEKSLPEIRKLLKTGHWCKRNL